MKRIIYTLLASALFMPLAHAQTEDVQKQVEGQLQSLRADGAELKKILEDHPDVRIAKIKVELAKEELSKIERNLSGREDHPDVRLARLKVGLAFEQLRQTQLELTKKYTELKLMIKIQKEKTDYYSDVIEKIRLAGAAIAPHELMPLQFKLIELKAELAKLETELQLLVGDKPKSEKVDVLTRSAKPNSNAIEVKFDISKIEPGSVLDKVKSIIDKPIEYSCKEKPAVVALNELNDKVGANVIVRLNDLKALGARLPVTAEGKMAISTWIEMILDDCNSQLTTIPKSNPVEKNVFDAYVRDYGILITYTSKRPQDAMTLREFTALVRAEKAKTEPKK